MQGYFRIALLLEVGNDRLAYQFGIPHHVQDLRIWGRVGKEVEITCVEKELLLLLILLVCFLTSYLIIFSVDQSQLEFELSGINGEYPRTTFSV